MSLQRTLNGGYESIKDEKGNESAGFSFSLAGIFGPRSTQASASDAPVVVQRTAASGVIATSSRGQQHAPLQSKESRTTDYGTFKF